MKAPGPRPGAFPIKKAFPYEGKLSAARLTDEVDSS